MCAEGMVGGANLSQINGCNPSSCTTPAGAGRVAGSAWEPIGLSMCTSVEWRLVQRRVLATLLKMIKNEAAWLK